MRPTPPEPTETHQPTYAGPPLFVALSFWVFVVGGLVFGGVFMINWKALLTRPEATVNVPVAGPVAIANLPVLPFAPKPDPVVIAIPQPPANPVAVVRTILPEWKGTERINLVLLGIDRRDDEPVDGTRSDTIMLVSIDPVRKSAAMVSLPRDLWVGIPGYGSQRINAAHAFGGPALVKRTLSADFGFNVQYYARVDFRGFEEMVDSMGGVVIDVERPIKDDEYPTEDYAYQRIYIGPGPQLLAGKTALQYARSRHSENDFGRARRQQRVILAMRDRALQLDMLPRAPALLGIVQQAISTDLSGTELLALARLASEIDADRVANVVVDTQLATPFKGADGADLLSPNIPGIRREIDRALQAANRPETQARLEILNGTTRAGVGQQASDALQELGFQVINVDVADRRDYQSTQVQVLAGDRTVGEAVANTLHLPPSAVVESAAQDAPADVRVILGQDYTTATASR